MQIKELTIFIFIGLITAAAYSNDKAMTNNLLLELQKDTISEISYDTLTYENEVFVYQVVFPDLWEGMIFEKFVLPELNSFDFNLYSNSDYVHKSEKYQKKGEIYISYFITHFSENIVSIKKYDSFYTHRMPSSKLYTSSLNLFKYNDDIYKVSLKNIDDNFIKGKLKELFEKEEATGCLGEVDHSCCQINLLFENGKAYLFHPLYIKPCDYDIKLSIENLEFTFENFNKD